MFIRLLFTPTCIKKINGLIHDLIHDLIHIGITLLQFIQNQRTIWRFFSEPFGNFLTHYLAFFCEPFGYSFEALLISEKKQVCRPRSLWNRIFLREGPYTRTGLLLSLFAVAWFFRLFRMTQERWSTFILIVIISPYRILRDEPSKVDRHKDNGDKCGNQHSA